MKKIITKTGESASHNVTFQATRIAHTAPVINFSYVNDDGEVIHVLVNGNELSDKNYMLHWGQPKGVINWKSKGENPDTRKRF